MYTHIYTLTHPSCSIQCIVCCMQCYQTPPRGKYVFVSVAGKYSPQVDHILDSTFIHRCPFVCLCLWHRCRLILLPPTRLRATFRAVLTILHFHRFQSFIHVPQSLAECISVLFHPFASPVIPLIRFCLFVISFSLSFAVTASLSLSPPFLCPSPLSWFPSFHHPRSDSVHSCTQYGIDWFPSAFSDLVVIVPERSRQIDFSEKDTVMFSNLWLQRAN